MKDVIAKNLPKVIEATLLSSEELAECEEFLPDSSSLPDDVPEFFYLRTPYEDNLIGCASPSGEDEPTEPDYEDMGDTFFGTALRPILRLENSKLKDGTELEAGDNVVIGKYTFTAISDTILFVDRPVWYDEEEKTFGIFDPETNVYENSLAKKRVDEWYKKEIIPNL